MTDTGLHGIAIYNPALLSKDELKRNFIARSALLNNLMDSLKREKLGSAPQHRLIIGLRGMGKTTLLRRFALAVEEDATLNQQWLPLTFPEEQYNVSKLADLWLNSLDALGDMLETSGDTQAAEKLDELISSLPKNDSELICKTLLNEAKKHGKRLLLMIDNIDLIFDRLKDEQWALRETLQAQTDLLIIGGSSVPTAHL